MAKAIFSRNDVESLSKRLEDRSYSVLMRDMPELQRDMRSAAKLLQFMVDKGIPPTPIELDNGPPPFAG
jgi:hypothetical protein